MGRALHWGTGSPASLSCLSLSHCVALGHVTSLSALAPLCDGVVPPNRALSACLLIFVLVKCLRGVLGEALRGHMAGTDPSLEASRSRALFSFPRARGRSHARRGFAGEERSGGPVALPSSLSLAAVCRLKHFTDSAHSALGKHAGKQTALLSGGQLKISLRDGG